ncbi:MAG: hypothetical protein Q9181_000618 [Wetmoreana brouardii]
MDPPGRPSGSGIHGNASHQQTPGESRQAIGAPDPRNRARSGNRTVSSAPPASAGHQPTVDSAPPSLRGALSQVLQPRNTSAHSLPLGSSTSNTATHSDNDLETQITAILQGRDSSSDPLSVGPDPWRFGQPNFYAMLQPPPSISDKVQTCPFFFPGCNCTKNGIAYFPFYFSNAEQADAIEYMEKMAYIPLAWPFIQPTTLNVEHPVQGCPASPQPEIDGLANFEQVHIRSDQDVRASSKEASNRGSDTPPAEQRAEESDTDSSLAPNHTTHSQPAECHVEDTGADDNPASDGVTKLGPAELQAEASGTCYRCHKGEIDGAQWVGCSNIERHGETGGWAHTSCVGLNRLPPPEDDWYCPECESENRRHQLYGADVPWFDPDPTVACRQRRQLRASARDLGTTYRGLPNGPSVQTMLNASDSEDYRLLSQPRKRLTAPSGPGLGRNNTESPTGGKRASEDDDDDEGAENEENEDLSTQEGSQAKSKRQKVSKLSYTEREQELVINYMFEELHNKNHTETKWDNIANQLATHGIVKTKWSIKNYWSRYGRYRSGLEERLKPKSRSMVTSKQKPEDRKRTREQKKREEMEVRSKAN